MVCGTEDGLFKGQSKVPGEVFYAAHETMELWADNHGAKAAPEVLKMTDEIRMTRYSPCAIRIRAVTVCGKGKRTSASEGTNGTGD